MFRFWRPFQLSSLPGLKPGPQVDFGRLMMNIRADDQRAQGPDLTFSGLGAWAVGLRVILGVQDMRGLLGGSRVPIGPKVVPFWDYLIGF